MDSTQKPSDTPVSEDTSADPGEMTELMRAHLDMVEGGAASFSAWFSNP